MRNVLITGANRGIGLELVRQYAAAGWRVLATCRNPRQATALADLAGEISIHALDVCADQSLKNLASELRGVALDLLINNAGMMGERSALGQINYQSWAEVLAVNTLSPIRVSEYFLEHVARSEGKTIAMITSKMGSISDNKGGGSYIYRSSKAALNAAAKSLSVDLAPRAIACVLIHPGWVQTDMGGPNALISTPESVRGIRNVLERATLKDSGAFFNYDGSHIPW